MRLSMKQLLVFIILIALTVFITLYELPYYIYKPGSADELSSIVNVDNHYESEGNMHLVTVSSMRATPITFLAAKLLSYHEVLPAEKVRPDDISDEDYTFLQLHMMENSQESSTVVAYEMAGKHVEIIESGVFVSAVLDDMPAEGILQPGDQIIKIDDHEISNSESLIDYVNTQEAHDEVNVAFVRENEHLEEKITLQPFSDDEERLGIGIQLITQQEVEVDPDVKFSSGNIGGPSAGLMFALEMYNQLIEEDLTRGKDIIGSGSIDLDGNVLRIGSVDKKVVAGHKAGCDVFFAANENGAEGSNYEEAKATAEALNSDMEIVPVDTFEEAVQYLRAMKE
ncbi:MAG TPA: SepM family pheromone-processing serine protease [Bacillota bacterium]|nr:SepM family pheromone-processing serine protease [Bacillota bacterium]